MRISEDQVNKFRTMMAEFANKYCVHLKWNRDKDNDPDIAELTFITDSFRMEGPTYMVKFSEARSLTDAAAPIMADVMFKLNVKNAGCCVEIKNVIFNPPATIVFWADGTKTVVKTQEYDQFDPEKGLAMAISKKALGNQGNYYNHFKKWTEKCKMSTIPFDPVTFEDLAAAVKNVFGIKD